MSQSWLSARELPCELNQLRRIAPRTGKPSPQRLPCHVAAFAVTQSDDVYDGSLRRIDPQWPAGTDVQEVAVQFERWPVELVQAHWRPERGAGAAAGNRDVDRGGYCVNKPMPRERRLEAQCRHRDALGYLNKVVICWRCVSPPVHAAAERDNLARVAKFVEALVADRGLSRLPIGKGIA